VPVTVRAVVHTAVEVRTIPIDVLPVDLPWDIEATVTPLVEVPTRAIVTSIEIAIVVPIVVPIEMAISSMESIMALLLDVLALMTSILGVLPMVAIVSAGGRGNGQHECQRTGRQGQGGDVFHDETSFTIQALLPEARQVPLRWGLQSVNSVLSSVCELI
jgi:hypothetical protein